MDFFDERILTVLMDGKSRNFRQLLGKMGFSHNTLRLHLRRLVDQGLIVKEKTSKGRGSYVIQNLYFSSESVNSIR